jgi:hypothetical protein
MDGGQAGPESLLVQERQEGLRRLRRPPSRRRLLAVIAVCVAFAVSVLLLFVLPVQQHFSFTNAAIYDPNTTCSPGVATTRGTTVSFHWSAPSPITFFVVHCSGSYDVPYSGNGTSGSGSFVSSGGVYQFGASCPEGPCVGANVSGRYTGPLLVL